MVEIKNVSPVGALEVPILHITIDAGATVEVPDDIAPLLLAQPDNFTEVKSAKPAKGSETEKGN